MEILFLCNVMSIGSNSFTYKGINSATSFELYTGPPFLNQLISVLMIVQGQMVSLLIPRASTQASRIVLVGLKCTVLKNKTMCQIGKNTIKG